MLADVMSTEFAAPARISADVFAITTSFTWWPIAINRSTSICVGSVFSEALLMLMLTLSFAPAVAGGSAALTIAAARVSTTTSTRLDNARLIMAILLNGNPIQYS
jgi:hypothetical protein